MANYEKIGAPRKRHGKWYFYKNNGLQNQYVMYQMDDLGGEPRVFPDPNTLSTDGTVALKGVYFSNNGRWAAYSISRSGSDWQEFYVIDLKTGQLTNDCLSGGFQEHQAAVGHVRHMLMAKIQKLCGINCN